MAGEARINLFAFQMLQINPIPYATAPQDEEQQEQIMPGIKGERILYFIPQNPRRFGFVY